MTTELPTFKLTIVKSDTQLENVCKRLIDSDHPLMAIDCETTGLDPRLSRLRLIQIASRGLQETFLIDYFTITNNKPLQEFLFSKKLKLNYNGQFDNLFLMHHANSYIEYSVDLFLGALLLQRYGYPEGVDPNSKLAWKEKLVPYLKGKLVTRGRNKGHGTLKLDSVLKLFTDIEMSKELQLSDWSRELTDAQLDYAAKDVELLFPLYDSMIEEINEEGLEDTFIVECECQLGISLMHYYGIKIDTNELSKLVSEIEYKIKNIEEKIGRFPEFQSDQQSMLDMMSGTTTTIDIGSPKQCAEALTRRWGDNWWLEAKMDKPSVQASDLRKFIDRDKELITLLSDRASLTSMLSNAGSLDDYINPITKRVHSNFLQNKGPQQRCYSENPILVNIPNVYKYGPGVSNESSVMYSKRNFRDLFVPEEGCVLVRCDYEALQLKAIAQESNDKEWIEIFNNNLDGHTITATVISGKKESEINKALRYCAKQVNYTVSFAGGPGSLRNTLAEGGVEVTLEECKNFIKRYKERYIGVTQYHIDQPEKVKRDKKVVIPRGRATLLNDHIYRLTDSVNFPAALYEVSGMKLALSRMSRILWYLKECGVKIGLLLIHDEMLIEVEENYAIPIAELVEREMIQCMREYIYKVPIDAKAIICRSWNGKAASTVCRPLPFSVNELNMKTRAA